VEQLQDGARKPQLQQQPTSKRQSLSLGQLEHRVHRHLRRREQWRQQSRVASWATAWTQTVIFDLRELMPQEARLPHAMMQRRTKCKQSAGWCSDE
jgi:hypothetical protein